MSKITYDIEQINRADWEVQFYGTTKNLFLHIWFSRLLIEATTVYGFKSLG